MIKEYSEVKDTAELVKGTAEAVTGEKPKGWKVRDYEIL